MPYQDSKKILPMIIGWREWVALPDLGIPKIKVKVDTGARSSSLHARNIQFFRKGKTRKVRFTIDPLQHSRSAEVTTEVPLIAHRHVRSSSGHREERPVILTTITIGEESWPIEITLSNRDMMGFRMLLGRQAIRDRFLVDAKSTFLTRKIKRRKTS